MICFSSGHERQTDRQIAALLHAPYHNKAGKGKLKLLIISARCNIYILHLCYDISVRLSVCDGSELAHYS